MKHFHLDSWIIHNLERVVAMDSRAETLAEKERSVTTSPRLSYNKEEDIKFDETPTDNEEGSVKNVPQETAASAEQEDETKYPSGFRLAAIVIALLLSIFLVCLPWISAFFDTDRLSGFS